MVDLVPKNGFRIFMDSFPGYIHSGDDFAMNSAGILYTEKTISQCKGFKEDGTPEFMRSSIGPSTQSRPMISSNFIVAKFFARHPEYKWQEKFLKDMKSYPWTLFEANR